ncbi:MAG: hypothetical protein WCL50_12420, partial [Spirochaetota bacterium]
MRTSGPVILPLGLLMFPFFLIGCGTLGHTDLLARSYGQVKIAEIRSLSKTQPRLALESLVAILGAEPLDSRLISERGDMEGLLQSNIDLLAEAHKKALQTGDDREAVATLRALVWLHALPAISRSFPAGARGLVDQGVAPITELVIAQAEKSWKSGNKALAMLQMSAILD